MNNGDEDYNPKFRKMRKKVCPLCADKNFVLDYKETDEELNIPKTTKFTFHKKRYLT